MIRDIYLPNTYIHTILGLFSNNMSKGVLLKLLSYITQYPSQSQNWEWKLYTGSTSISQILKD